MGFMGARGRFGCARGFADGRGFEDGAVDDFWSPMWGEAQLRCAGHIAGQLVWGWSGIVGTEAVPAEKSGFKFVPSSLGFGAIDISSGCLKIEKEIDGPIGRDKKLDVILYELVRIVRHHRPVPRPPIHIIVTPLARFGGLTELDPLQHPHQRGQPHIIPSPLVVRGNNVSNTARLDTAVPPLTHSRSHKLPAHPPLNQCYQRCKTLLGKVFVSVGGRRRGLRSRLRSRRRWGSMGSAEASGFAPILPHAPMPNPPPPQPAWPRPSPASLAAVAARAVAAK